MYDGPSLLQNLNPQRPREQVQYNGDSDLISQIPFQTQLVGCEASSQVTADAENLTKVGENATLSLLDALRTEHQVDQEPISVTELLNDEPGDCEQPKDSFEHLPPQIIETDQAAVFEAPQPPQEATISNELTSSLESLQCRPAVSELLPPTSSVPAQTEQTQTSDQMPGTTPLCLVDVIRDIRAGTSRNTVTDHSFRRFRHVGTDQKKLLDADTSWYPRQNGQASRAGSVPIDVLRRLESQADASDGSSLQTNFSNVKRLAALAPTPDKAAQADQRRDRDEDNDTVYASQWTTSPSPGPKLPPDSSPPEETSTLHLGRLVDTQTRTHAAAAPATSAKSSSRLDKSEVESGTEDHGDFPSDAMLNRASSSRSQQDGVDKPSRVVRIASNARGSDETRSAVVYVKDTPYPRRNIIKEQGQEDNTTQKLQSPFVPATLPPRSIEQDQNPKQPYGDLEPESGNRSSTDPSATTSCDRHSIVNVEAQISTADLVRSSARPIGQSAGERRPWKAKNNHRPVLDQPGLKTSVAPQDTDTRVETLQNQAVLTEGLDTTDVDQVKIEQYYDDAYKQMDQDRKIYRQKFYKNIARAQTRSTATPQAHLAQHLSLPEIVRMRGTDGRTMSQEQTVLENPGAQTMAGREREVQGQIVQGQGSKDCANDATREMSLSPPAIPGRRYMTPGVCQLNKVADGTPLPHWHGTKRKHSDSDEDEKVLAHYTSELRTSRKRRSGSFGRYTARSDSNNDGDRRLNLSSVHERFAQTYTSYKGTLKQFTGSVSLLQRLRREGREPHPSLWDDFIFRRHQEYREFLQECMEGDENAIPYEAFYHERIMKPVCMTGVVTPQIFERLGSQQHGMGIPHTDQTVLDNKAMIGAPPLSSPERPTISASYTTVRPTVQSVSMSKTGQAVVDETEIIPTLSSQLSKVSEASAERISKWLERAPGASSPELRPATGTSYGRRNVEQKKARRSLPATFSQLSQPPVVVAAPSTVPRLSSAKAHDLRTQQIHQSTDLCLPETGKNRDLVQTPTTNPSQKTSLPASLHYRSHARLTRPTFTPSNSNHPPSELAQLPSEHQQKPQPPPPPPAPQSSVAAELATADSTKYALSAQAYTRYLQATSSLHHERQRLALPEKQRRLPIDIFRWQQT